MDLAEAADRYCGEFVSHAPGDRLAALAPHGGGIEPGTDRQAFMLADRLAACSAWTFRGYQDGGGAFDRFHGASSAIDPGEYRLLGEVATDQLEYAVAFHGYRHDGVYVGGGLPRWVRSAVADRIDALTPVPATPATSDDGDRYAQYAGRSPKNVVNRLPSDGGLQLEQGITARDDHGEAIVAAVAEALIEAGLADRSG